MNRRIKTILLPLAAAVLAAGCSTFDTDTVASVNGEDLTVDELDELLLAVGAQPEDLEGTLPLVPVRQAIGDWIQSEANLQLASSEASVSPDQAASLFDRGIEAAGISCPLLMLTESIETADAAVQRLEDGDDFAAVFAESNVEPGLVATGGSNGCFPLAQLGEAVRATPDGQALFEINSDNVARSAIVPLQDGTQAGFVVTHRDYAELDANEQAQVVEIVNAQSRLDSLDISVDPRYGTYDAGTGQVIPLG